MSKKLTDSERAVLEFRLWFDGCMSTQTEECNVVNVQSVDNHFFIVDNIFDPECDPDIISFMKKAIDSEVKRRD